MRNSLYSNNVATSESESARRAASIRYGVVDAVNVEENTVRVRFDKKNSTTCQIFSQTVGDAWYPEPQDFAIVAPKRDSDDLLLGTVTVSSSMERGERIVGHSASETQLRFNNDGSIAVIPDGATAAVCTIDSDGIHIADNQVVTDISTTTDADGHVTSVDPIYTDTLSL